MSYVLCPTSSHVYFRPMAPIPAEWAHHLQDEADAAFLYRQLADLEPDQERAEIYRDLAQVEERHVLVWTELIEKETGSPPAASGPGVRARVLARLARWFGPRLLLPLLLEEEGREVKSYLALYQGAPAAPTAPAALMLARESKAHAGRLAGLVDGGELDTAGLEPWHKAGAGGVLRNVVYGFNDGLTANFGLLAGMVGAQATLGTGDHVVLAGLAGMVADALSMGSSGYLAARSEREVYAYEIAREAEEIRLMPELEQEELRLIYRAKGIPEADAARLAAAVMADPERALTEKTREELGIAEATSTPMREALITGAATAFGAFIPVAPLLMSTAPWAIWTSFAVAMASHFLVGAARSLLTGRGIVRSGMDMFLVGLGVAVVGYFLGDWIVRVL